MKKPLRFSGAEQVEILQAENAELRRIAHTAQSQMKLAMAAAERQEALVRILATVATKAGGTLDVTHADMEAAMLHNAFRFVIEPVKQPDGRVDSRIVVNPLTAEERKAMTAKPEPPQDCNGRLILPE